MTKKSNQHKAEENHQTTIGKAKRKEQQKKTPTKSTGKQGLKWQ